ncbi:hypothetical protein JCM17844_04740 [Iodidimonas gelatinilytica]|uniref:DXP reductoisomerase C-terminal domain-containing protein n=1 Tax=Iodidimonas gelatinilytica TaxID=1236966 RepID=A0A5A7MLN3_9PROT|nr:hypothetical protein JCM17844_04740 [Iodidimonas gelatinilytica]GER01168.1 hypothetical protein JCM17845_17910 [Iodidimonas gelatinilytica]
MKRLDLAQISRLDFEAPDDTQFPALRMAREALRQGGFAPTILNAANEIAVAAFLDRRIGFLDITSVVENCLAAFPHSEPDSLESIYDMDARVRAQADICIKALA